MTLVERLRTKLGVRLVLLGVIAVAAFGISAIPAMSENPETFGNIPEEAWMADGSVDTNLVPDFITALARDGSIAGYVSANHLFGDEALVRDDQPIPVIDKERNLVGHMVPGRGFVAVGEPFDSVEKFPVTLYEGMPDGSIRETVIEP